MPGSGYVVDLRQHGTALGAAFLLAPCYALTAAHCLAAMAADDERVSVHFGDGLVLDGRVCQRDPAADLALVLILQPERVPPTLPSPDLPRAGDPWHAPYRPSLADPRLSGHVNSPSIPYDTEAGGRVEAVQLAAEQELGDYSGYSGSPVQRTGPDELLPVLGILIEQYPDRAAPERHAGVLFAVTMREAMDRLSLLRAGHLNRVLEGREKRAPAEAGVGRVTMVALAGGGRSAPAAATATLGEEESETRRERTTRTLLSGLKELSARDLMDPAQLGEAQMYVWKRYVDVSLREEAG